MEMMEVDEPLSSLEAQRAPALDTEEGLLIPVAGPETPCRPTSGMPGLTPTGEHVTALKSITYSTGVKESMLLIVSLPCFCNSLSVFYFKMMSNLVIFGGKNKKN